MKQIRISPTAQEIPEGFSAEISVVIDVLRASSVIITALSHGCPYILPAGEIDEAKKLKKRFPEALLAGERKAKIISGFDRGNSPFEHQNNPDQNPIILTTTNGTATLIKVKNSGTIAVAGFLNLNAIAHYIQTNHFSDVHLACAGTNRRFSLDDFMLAGALSDRLKKDFRFADDFTRMAANFFAAQQGRLHDTLRPSTHYQTLLELGLQKDLDYCLQVNTSDTIPLVIQKDPLIISVHQKET